MSMLSSFMHPQNAFKDARQTMKDYYDKANASVQPYNDFGQKNITNQQTYIDSLMHPEKLQDEWIKNYHESEAAKQNEAMAQENGTNAASSMGLGGSNTAVNAIQAGTSQIGNADRQQYLDDLMKKYTLGSGLTTNAVNTGAGAATTQSQNDMTQGQNDATLKYGESNAPGKQFGQYGDMLQKMITDYLTGGMGEGGFGRGAWSPT